MGVRRTIPGNMSPWSCEINGVKYQFRAGERVDVPESVAAIIDAYEASLPREDPPSPVATREGVKEVLNEQKRFYTGIEGEPALVAMVNGSPMRMEAGAYTGLVLYDKEQYGFCIASEEQVRATPYQSGLVKQAAKVAPASGDTVSASEFNALLAALTMAGILAE